MGLVSEYSLTCLHVGIRAWEVMKRGIETERKGSSPEWIL